MTFSFITSIPSRLLDLLQGEPLRVIVYGTGLAIWAVAAVSNRIPDISLDNALIQATAVAATLTEICRKLVFSPNTVAVILEASPASVAKAATVEGDTE